MATLTLRVITPARIALDETPSRDMIAGLSADVKVITAK